MEIEFKKNEKEKEVLEMILQFLYENRLNESAKLLENKCGLKYEQNEFLKIKIFLKDNRYDECLEYINNFNLNSYQKNELSKIIKTRKFIQLIKEKDLNSALLYLRKEISPFITDKKILNKYSILLFQKEEDSIKKHLNQNFSEIIFEDKMIDKIQSVISMSRDLIGRQILPSSRLEKIVNESVNISEVNGRIINSNLNYYSQQIEKIKLSLIIDKHDDEVWHMDYSDGLLATCSRNGMIGVFTISNDINSTTVKCINYFSSHKKYVTSINWSKSKTYLLTSSADKTIKLWSPLDGHLIKTFSLHTDIVSSVRWINEEIFVSGGIDKKLFICTTDNRVTCSETFFRIRKVLLSEALNSLVIVPASLNDIILFNYKTHTELDRINELDPIISANLSKHDEGRFLITNLSKVNSSLNLYDLTTRKLINKFYGHSQEQYSIECSFAGKNDEFIISGSEDASIYIWNRLSSIPLKVIKGHMGSVNNCILNEDQFGKLFIFSVSDDQTLRIWGENKVIYEDVSSKKSKRERFSVSHEASGDRSSYSHSLDDDNVLVDHELSDEDL